MAEVSRVEEHATRLTTNVPPITYMTMRLDTSVNASSQPMLIRAHWYKQERTTANVSSRGGLKVMFCFRPPVRRH